MRLSKNEVISLREILHPLKDNLINTKRASIELLSSSPISHYSNYNTTISRERLEDLAQNIPHLEEDLITLIESCRNIISDLGVSVRLMANSREYAILGLIKTGIRVGYQPNTYLLIDNISYVKDHKLSDNIIAALYKEL